MVATNKLVVDPELQSWLEGVPETCDVELERSLLADKGPRNPIVVWKGKNVIVDGHRRYTVCVKHNLPFQVEEREFSNKAAVKAWMDSEQGGRRNQTPAQFQRLLARLIEARRSGKSISTVQAVKEVASEAGVSERKVYRAKEYAEALASLPSDVRQLIETEEVSASSPAVIELAGYGTAEQRDIVSQVKSGEYATLTEALRGDGEDAPAEPPAGRVAGDEPPRSKPSRFPIVTNIKECQKKLGHFARALDVLKTADRTHYKRCRALIDDLSNDLEAWIAEAQ